MQDKWRPDFVVFGKLNGKIDSMEKSWWYKSKWRPGVTSKTKQNLEKKPLSHHQD
jgi:hypothetical protein